jgi:dihydrofolate synthase/folylpolyglutamate synthase
MTYAQTVEYLYQSLPMFQRVGAVAFKKDLTNTLALCRALGNPQHKFKSIHVAGTNGKGSSSHMLAAVLQTAGYKTGLYTSPHLKEFTERIRINGREVEKEFVVDFVERIRPEIEKIQPSFFEITVAMAFDYFVRKQVDVAVIETGLGGRLDSTNVITPLLSLITNISFDHMDLLGDTLPQIAGEKAGIIKPQVPVVISERQPEVEEVFISAAARNNSPITFASDQYAIDFQGKCFRATKSGKTSTFAMDLAGAYQKKNLPGVLAAIEVLRNSGFRITDAHVHEGLQNVTTLTGLKGRWQVIGQAPLIVCDTGHNESGLKEVIEQINVTPHRTLRAVIGMVKDKDLSKILSLLPRNAVYYFCEAKIPRALPAAELMKRAAEARLQGVVIPDVNEALARARQESNEHDLIWVGGSTFVVAEVASI